MDIVILALKFGGAFLAGTLAVLGLLGRFRRDPKSPPPGPVRYARYMARGPKPAGGGGETGWRSLTPTGRLAFVLMILSGVLSVGSSAYEERSKVWAKQEELLRLAREAAERDRQTQAIVSRSDRTLSDVGRLLHPVGKVRLGCRIRVPMDDRLFAAYLSRFDGAKQKALDAAYHARSDMAKQKAIDPTSPARGIVFRHGEANDGFEPFEIDGWSDLAPDRDTEPLPHAVLGQVSIGLDFYRQPIPLREHPAIGPGDGRPPDLAMRFSSLLAIQDMYDRHVIEYDRKAHTFRLLGNRLRSDSRPWRSTGEVADVEDLMGAQMFVSLRPGGRLGGDGPDAEVAPIRKQFVLDGLIIDAGERRTLRLSPRTWTGVYQVESVTDSDGYPVSVFTFSSDREQFGRLLRN